MLPQTGSDYHFWTLVKNSLSNGSTFNSSGDSNQLHSFRHHTVCFQQTKASQDSQALWNSWTRTILFSGNMDQLKSEPTPNDIITSWLKKYGNVFGYYLGEIPYIVVNDLEMLKQVFIKDFHMFVNRPDMLLDISPLNNTVGTIQGKRWKEVRTLLTPTFSSGKIKLMTSIVDKKVDVTVNEISKRAEKNEMFDIYQLVQGLTLDVISDCALAMKTHCQENSQIFSLLLNYLTSGQMTKLIVDSVKSAIDVRRKNPEFKSMDLLQIMLDHRESDPSVSSGLTDEEIVANAYVFILAGFETTANALAFTFYLLIKHPDIQEKLYQEIKDIEDSNYNSIQSIPYLDQVFSESLRCYLHLPDSYQGHVLRTIRKKELYWFKVCSVRSKTCDIQTGEKVQVRNMRKNCGSLTACMPYCSNQSSKWCISQGYTAHYYALKDKASTGMEVFLTLLVVLASSFGFVILRWAINRHQRLKLLKRYGIPGPEPSFLSGNMDQLKSEPTPNDLITSWLKKYGNVFGYYLGEIPYVVVNDLEMLKQMFIKDFNVFTNRQEMHLDVSPLNKTILALKDKRWKEVRSLLTPTFSSGKIKLMTNIVDKK
ncbi:cytochrome P450 3A24, partial [Trichonephila inaurata madagascariensis]